MNTFARFLMWKNHKELTIFIFLKKKRTFFNKYLLLLNN